ncbi:Nitric oxide oxidoreductase [Vermiconidia calcicola]|uniref:Nitric oxide oxidoreductase n=1 Tax=Vermiconidia calcicola TaxID=1690605 RepID=A0ACC3P0T7_9PEZI|nr:Nitric oxide oxidoreductase [Vermiconidia calcicola]
MGLTSEQVQTIRSTAPILQEHGNTITTSFYSTMLKEVPDLKNVFNQANQVNGHQPAALAASLHAYATNIDDLGALSPAVEKICQKHASLYIQPKQYEVVGEYLLRAMGEVLGSALTPEVLDAWTAAYWQLANLMITREEQLVQDADGWTDWREFRIADKVKESEVITSFYLEPVDKKPLPSFMPGQYISVQTYIPKLGYRQSRQYSLSDAPHADWYRISVKKEEDLNLEHPEVHKHPGLISNILHDEKNIGDILEVSHPAGEFFLDTEGDLGCPIVLLSAGVGITPMMSMLDTLVANGTDQPITFVHGAHSFAQRAFSSQLQTITHSHPHVRYVSFIKNPDVHDSAKDHHYDYTGREDVKKLDRVRNLFLDNDTTRYFVCGPNSFMDDVWHSLTEMGVGKDRIKMEVFGTGMPTTN